MGRPVEFRAWDKENKWMIYDDDQSVADKYGTGTGQTIHNTVWRIGKFYKTLMQYTGLKDKNGKRIYHSDIVRINNFEPEFKYDNEIKNCNIFTIEWNKYTWAFNNNLIYMPLTDYSSKDGELYDIEVIGNIYENSILLES